MSQRQSGYRRRANDLYETPEWVTDALWPHMPREALVVWEPAAGGQKMVRALRKRYRYVAYNDVTSGDDFLKSTEKTAATIITNPPFGLAREFIEHALSLTENMVAMLLPTDYDHAKTRRHLFDECPAFAKKVQLLRRIVWFEPAVASPSSNHAWFIWDHRHSGPPTLAYAL